MPSASDACGPLIGASYMDFVSGCFSDYFSADSSAS